MSALLNFIGRKRTQEKYKDVPKDLVILHQFPRGLRAPSVSPFPVKLETWYVFNLKKLLFNVNSPFIDGKLLNLMSTFLTRFFLIYILLILFPKFKNGYAMFWRIFLGRIQNIEKYLNIKYRKKNNNGGEKRIMRIKTLCIILFYILLFFILSFERPPFFSHLYNFGQKYPS
jgi:hypothetical protein